MRGLLGVPEGEFIGPQPLASPAPDPPYPPARSGESESSGVRLYRIRAGSDHHNRTEFDQWSVSGVCRLSAVAEGSMSAA